jgi:hypothetical protein
MPVAKEALMKSPAARLLLTIALTAAVAAVPFARSEMQGGSAIRGCENYTEMEPVFQESPAACLAYCESNNADACEYRDAPFSQCYVEFGTGCQVEEGYYSWNAAVLHP